ncbi:hypothetical protein JW935_08705 [candidate division KSB1 bacterium]|nr:hypothetical protein [candidate division KSB1 bacterium]
MEKRRYTAFGRKYLLQNMPFFIVLALLFVIAWTHGEKQDVLFWISLFLFVAGCIGGLVWDKKRTTRFKCPQCGKLIRTPVVAERKGGDPIDYYCPTCDIQWQTGLREAED